MEKSTVLSHAVIRGKKNPLHFGLPARLKDKRRGAKLTLSKIASDAGISVASVLNVERKKTAPLVSTAEKIAMGLQVSPAWLAFGFGEPDPWPPCPDLRSAGLAGRLRVAREALGITRAALGTASGLTGQGVQNVETDTVPSLATIEKLAKALGVSPAWLAFGEEATE